MLTRQTDRPPESGHRHQRDGQIKSCVHQLTAVENEEILLGFLGLGPVLARVAGRLDAERY